MAKLQTIFLRENPKPRKKKVARRRRKAVKRRRVTPKARGHFVVEIIAEAAARQLHFTYLGAHGKRVEQRRAAEHFHSKALAEKNARAWWKKHGNSRLLRGLRVIEA